METKTSSRNKARLIVVTVFVIGFGAGALSLNLYQQMTSSDKKNAPQHGPEFLIKRLHDRVGLTNDQEDQIRKVLVETNDKYREIRTELEPRIKDFEPRFNAVREQSRDRIRALLTPEQLPKYEKMIEERDRMREQEKERNKK
ncbi:MAG TPA: hypothetical protein VLM38_08075 [Blastocatellia bacterium]|nr:hypothetical protein [Blastocatellia bacterium]